MVRSAHLERILVAFLQILESSIDVRGEECAADDNGVLRAVVENPLASRLLVVRCNGGLEFGAQSSSHGVNNVLEPPLDRSVTDALLSKRNVFSLPCTHKFRRQTRHT